MYFSFLENPFSAGGSGADSSSTNDKRWLNDEQKHMTTEFGKMRYRK